MRFQSHSAVERAGSAPGSRSSLAARLAVFVPGMAVLSAGILLIVRSPWGAAAWDVFHLGIVAQTGLTLGSATIVVSFAILGVTLALGGGWTIRLGTVLNAFLAGAFVDLYTALGLVPEPSGWLWGAAYLLGGIGALALGTVIYLRTGLGAGARDGLMLVLSQRTRLTPGTVRMILEGAVALLGWLLGGPLGVGTVVAALAIGPVSDLFFRILGPGALGDRVRISGTPPGAAPPQSQQEVLVPEGKQ